MALGNTRSTETPEGIMTRMIVLEDQRDASYYALVYRHGATINIGLSGEARLTAINKTTLGKIAWIPVERGNCHRPGISTVMALETDPRIMDVSCSTVSDGVRGDRSGCKIYTDSTRGVIKLGRRRATL